MEKPREKKHSFGRRRLVTSGSGADQPRLRSVRVHSDSVRYHGNAPIRQQPLSSSVSETAHITSSHSPRKTESEPGTWTKPNSSLENDEFMIQMNADERIYPKRQPPTQAISRFHHRNETRKSTRSRESVPTGTIDRSNAHDNALRNSSELSFKHSAKSSRTESVESFPNMSTLSMRLGRGQRSSSPKSKGRPASLNNLNMNLNGITVIFWNGKIVNLDCVKDESIGDALRKHITDMTKPLECVDSNIDTLIPWNTPVNDLIRKILYIREIGKLATVTVTTPTPLTPMSKKSEKRISTTSENSTLGLQLWFSYCTEHLGKKQPNPIDQLELKCFLENVPSCIRSVYCTPTNGGRSRSRNQLQTLMPDGGDSNDIDLIENWDTNRKHLFSLETNWDAFVRTDSQLSTREQQRQSAIWELFVTELNYINYLRSILDTYSEPFNCLREQQFLELDSAKIFNNLEQVYATNLKLWFGYLHPAYCQARETENLLDAFMLEQGFMKIPKLFTPYMNYCMGLQPCQRYIKKATVTNSSFATFLKWADSVGSEHRESLWDRIAKPFKRVTQYNLMLENIRKYCEDPEEQHAIDRMHLGIGEFLKVLDQRMHQVEQRGRVESLENDLLFPDCQETTDEEYQPLFNQYKRISLMEDIELPPPVILTVPEVLEMLKLNGSDQNIPIYAQSSTTDSSLRSNSLSKAKTLMYRSESNLNQSTFDWNDSDLSNLINASRWGSHNGIDIPEIQSMQTGKTSTPHSAIPVLLTRWDPPPSYKMFKSNASILDRIRTTRIPTESRRTVPRSLLRKGYLRFREAQGKWIDTTCFLLTDQFIITKFQKRTNKDHLKVIRSPIRLDKLVVHKINESGLFACAMLDDFNMINSVYTFHTGSVNCEEWCSLLRKTKERFLEMMRPEILFVTPQGSIPPQIFQSKQNSSSSSLSSQVSKPTPSLNHDHKRSTLLHLSNSKARQNLDRNIPGVYRRPIRPSVFSPPQDSALVITDTRARPLVSFQSKETRESRRLNRMNSNTGFVSPLGSATKNSSTTAFFTPEQLINEQTETPFNRNHPTNQSVKTIAINGTASYADKFDNHDNKFTPPMRADLQPFILKEQLDSGSEILQEDRIIHIDNAYGLRRSRKSTFQSIPNLNSVHYSTPLERMRNFNANENPRLRLSQSDRVGTEPIFDSTVDRLIRTTNHHISLQPSLQSPSSNIHIVKQEAATTSTRC